jgi:hypothetical protein
MVYQLLTHGFLCMVTTTSCEDSCHDQEMYIRRYHQYRGTGKDDCRERTICLPYAPRKQGEDRN